MIKSFWNTITDVVNFLLLCIVSIGYVCDATQRRKKRECTSQCKKVTLQLASSIQTAQVCTLYCVVHEGCNETQISKHDVFLAHPTTFLGTVLKGQAVLHYNWVALYKVYKRNIETI